jgi:hypothetical protein
MKVYWFQLFQKFQWFQRLDSLNVLNVVSSTPGLLLAQECVAIRKIASASS